MRTTRVTAIIERRFETARLGVYDNEPLSLIIEGWYVVNLLADGTLSRARSVSSDVLWGAINGDSSIVEVQEP